MEKDGKRQLFIDKLKESGGVICLACEAAGINRSTYYRWRESDTEFAEAVDEVMEAQIDYVESQLMGRINEKDTTATIFYLKTKGKKRGWTEKEKPQPTADNTEQLDTALSVLPIQEAGKPVRSVIGKRIKNKKDYIVKLLKQQGKYTAELSMQVTITAQLLVRTEILAEEVLSEEHEAVNVELSREGNERKTISPKEKLYLDFVQQSQRALRALGMNTDSKERKTDNDVFSEFMEEFRKDE